MGRTRPTAPSVRAPDALTQLAAKGGPPALPGRQPLFDISGGRLVEMWLCARKRAMDGRFGSESLKREDWDKGWLRSSSPSRKGPFEGPATAKPPALPGDAYSKRRVVG